MNAEKVENVKQCEPPVLRAFASEEFGSIRSIMIDSDPWFVGKARGSCAWVWRYRPGVKKAR